MSFGALLHTIIYLISSILFYPALVVLLISVVILVLNAGSFASEWAERARRKTSHNEDWPAMPRASEASYAFMGQSLEQLDAILQKPDPGWVEVELLLSRTRRFFQKKLDPLRILVRLGPAVGLIGTLIPMSTGLAAMSQGDMSRLASDLVMAFTTTVVGLSVGAASFVLYTVRSRWVESDLEVLALVMENRCAGVLGGPCES